MGPLSGQPPSHRSNREAASGAAVVVMTSGTSNGFVHGNVAHAFEPLWGPAAVTPPRPRPPASTVTNARSTILGMAKKSRMPNATGTTVVALTWTSHTGVGGHALPHSNNAS